MDILLKNQRKRRFAVAICVLFTVFLATSINYTFAQTSIEFYNIQVLDIQGKTVKIKWSTNTETYGKVIFGKSKDNLDNYLIDNNGIIMHHNVILGNLEPETTYYFQIIASDIENRVYSFVQSFKTLEYHDKIAPEISGMDIPYKSGTLAVVTWQTNEPATSVVIFDKYQTYKTSASNSTKTTNHQVVLKNLAPYTIYYYKVYSVDKDNNQSNVYENKFSTWSDQTDKEDLIISNLRPAGPSDSQISDTSVTINFKTNHWAYGYVYLGSYVKSLDYGQNHEVTFTNLTPETDYSLYVSMADVFNKSVEVKSITIKTKDISLYQNNSDKTIINYKDDFRYYGGQFNSTGDLVISDIRIVGFKDQNTSNNNIYIIFKTNYKARVEGITVLGPNYHQITEYNYNYNLDHRFTLSGINPNTEYYLYINVIDNTGIKASVVNGKFRTGENFTSLDNSNSTVSTTNNTTTGYINGSEINGVIVKGMEFSLYSKATALYKTLDSPDIYAIVNGQRHYISSPTSFNEYGYNWLDIKTVSWQELFQYPRARLIKSPESSIIYYLYQRPENQWLKIALPSPTAFVSYPGNYWGNVIIVTQLDINNYPDVKLIKAVNDSAIYYLENNIKHFISEQVFKEHDFSVPEIVQVSQVHLNTYKTGSLLK